MNKANTIIAIIAVLIIIYNAIGIFAGIEIPLFERNETRYTYTTNVSKPLPDGINIISDTRFGIVVTSNEIENAGDYGLYIEKIDKVLSNTQIMVSASITAVMVVACFIIAIADSKETN